MFLNESSGEIALSPHLNTNVPTRATFELSVSDGQNEANARLHLQVNLVTETMLANSVQLRLAFEGTRLESMQTLFNRLQDAFSALLHCSREAVVIFNMQTSLERPNLTIDTSYSGFMNVSLAVRASSQTDIEEQYILADLLRERLYLGRTTFAQITGLHVS